MAEKDIHEKLLEDYNDVFADIYNTLVFGELFLQKERLSAGPTASIYKSECGDSEEQLRDVLKNYGKSQLGLMSLGIENQTDNDKTMPIRVMGYDYGSYRGMIKNGGPIRPVMTIVLNFGEKRWHKAKSLHELLKLPDKLKPYIEDYKIRVYDIAFLSDNVIEQFTSDFKIVARFFKDRRLKRSSVMKDSSAKIHHTEAVLDFLSVFTKDNCYRNLYTQTIKEKEENGEVIDMCWIAQELINEGKLEGRLEGKTEGRTEGLEKGLAALVKSLKPFVADLKELHKIVTGNEDYAHVTEDQVQAYYEG